MVELRGYVHKALFLGSYHCPSPDCRSRDSPNDPLQVLTSIGQLPPLEPFINSLHNCDYKAFFRVGDP